MSNIYIESKGPVGPWMKESLQFASAPGVSLSRGLAVSYGSDQFHIALIAALATQVIGILEEDAIVTTQAGVQVVGEPNSVIEFGQAIAQIGATVAVGQALAANANGLLVPATAGQQVVAIALEPQTYVSPGSFACVFVVAVANITYGGAQTFYYTASGALAPVTGTHVLNGAGVLAMTLVAPPNDGIDMFIVAETAHAHTVTTPADGIENLKHILTYAAEGDSANIRSAAGTWMRRGALTGPTPCALS